MWRHLRRLPITRDTLRNLGQRLNRTLLADESPAIDTADFSPLVLPVESLSPSPNFIPSTSPSSKFSSCEIRTPLKFLRSFTTKGSKESLLHEKDTLPSSEFYGEMASHIRIRPFKGSNDGSEDPNEFLEDIECVAEAFEVQNNASMMIGLEKSQKRFFRQYLSEDGDAAYWWQYVLMSKDKISYETIKEKFLVRYGNSTAAAQSRFEIQNEIMALKQNQGEDIASYVRKAEKLSKRVLEELDSMMALCLIKGMTNELKKADISYIVQSQPKTSFRDAIEIIKVKYRVIGEPDSFGLLGGRKPEKTSANWGAAYAVPPANGPATIPVGAAARMGQIPSYNVGRRMGEDLAASAGQSKEVYGDSGGLAAALEGCGISHQQLKGLVDWYLKDSGSESTKRARADDERRKTQGDFHQPALPTPGVINPVRGEGQNASLQQARTSGNANTAPSGISCFSCSRRGHYSSTCPYPPRPMQDQERLREQARMNRLQRAVLLPGATTNTRMAGAVYSTQVSRDPEPRIEELKNVAETENHRRKHADTGHATERVLRESNESAEIHTNMADNTRAGRIGAACAILSRLPPVMTIVQDVMAGKRTRTQDENSEVAARAPANKTPRMRQVVAAESVDNGDNDEEEELIETVFVPPAGSRRSAAGENTRAIVRERARASGSERRLPMGREIDMENDERAQPSPVEDALTPESTGVPTGGI